MNTDNKSRYERTTFRSLFGKSARVRLRMEKVRAVARVIAFGGAVCAVIGLVSARSAYGSFKDSALITGRQLASFGDLQGSVYRVLLNGQTIHVAAGSTEQSMKEILDDAQTMCKQHTGGLDTLIAQLPEGALGIKKGEDTTQLMGIMRSERDGEGMVACLAQQPLDGWQDLSQRLGRFVETGDLSEVGNLRYMYVRKINDKSNQVIAAWTQDNFKMFDMFPKNGQDTPGTDALNAPRPPESVRIFSATIEGAIGAVRIYDSASSKNEILALYDKQMPERGWTLVPQTVDKAPNARLFTRETADLLVVTTEIDGRSYISVTETRPH